MLHVLWWLLVDLLIPLLPSTERGIFRSISVGTPSRQPVAAGRLSRAGNSSSREYPGGIKLPVSLSTRMAATSAHSNTWPSAALGHCANSRDSVTIETPDHTCQVTVTSLVAAAAPVHDEKSSWREAPCHLAPREVLPYPRSSLSCLTRLTPWAPLHVWQGPPTTVALCMIPLGILTCCHDT